MYHEEKCNDFDVEAMEMDLSSRESIQKLIAKAQEHGEITMWVNVAVFPQARRPLRRSLRSMSVRPSGDRG